MRVRKLRRNVLWGRAAWALAAAVAPEVEPRALEGLAQADVQRQIGIVAVRLQVVLPDFVAHDERVLGPKSLCSKSGPNRFSQR